MVAGGASHRSVAEKFGVSHFAIGRHWKHVPEERKAAMMLGPWNQAALAARASDESESVLDHLKAVRAGLYALYSNAVNASDRTGGALLAGRLHENLNAMARLTGQILSSPFITNNTVINNTLSLQQNAEFEQLKADLVGVLQKHPEALRDVIAEFDRLESQSAPQDEALPVLEHHAEETAA